MASDLDRHCASLERNLETRIDRLDAILANRRVGSRYDVIRAERDACVIELHDTRRTHNAYDARRAEAMSDPTGQDEDAFDHGESSNGWQPCGGGYLSDGRGGYRENFGY